MLGQHKSKFFPSPWFQNQDFKFVLLQLRCYGVDQVNTTTKAFSKKMFSEEIKSRVELEPAPEFNMQPSSHMFLLLDKYLCVAPGKHSALLTLGKKLNCGEKVNYICMGDIQLAPQKYTQPKKFHSNSTLVVLLPHHTCPMCVFI